MKNKTMYFIIIFGFLVLFAGGLIYQQVSAQARSLMEIPAIQQPSSVPSFGISQQETAKESKSPPSERFPLSVLVSSEQKAKNEEIIAAAKELRDKADKKFLSPGWVRITSKTESFFALSATLPNGAPVPTESINDIWALLDDEGYALMAVTIDDTGDPRTSQVVVFQDGIWTNLSTGGLSPQEAEGMTSQDVEVYKPSLGSMGFISFAEYYKDILILSMEKTEIDVNGKSTSVSMFSATELFKEPTDLAKTSTMLAGASSKEYFSFDTGLLLVMEEYNLYPTGELKMIRRWTLLNVEKVDTPPDEILAYFIK